MQKNNLKLITALIIIVLIIVFIVFWNPNKLDQKERISTTFVNTTSVSQVDTDVYVEAVGNVEAYATVNIKALIDGQLLKVGFNEGDFVKEGQVLFKIDPRPFDVALDQAKANLVRDQAQFVAASALLTRDRKLVKQGYVTKQDFDQVQADHDALAATIRADQAAVANAELQLSYCTITAPFTGRTGGLLVDEGNLVKASDTDPLVIINQVSPIYVTFSIPEKQFGAVRQELRKGKVMVQARIDNDNTIKEGQIDFVDNTVDLQTGMIKLKAIFPNVDHHFWPGQFIKITLPISKIAQALLVPTRAVQVGQNGYYVFVVKDNITNIVPVVLGESVGDKTIVTKGLNLNDIVITEGQLHLANGMKVRTH